MNKKNDQQEKLIRDALEHRLLSPTYKVFKDIPNASDEIITKHFLFWIALKTSDSVRSVENDAIYLTYHSGEESKF